MSGRPLRRLAALVFLLVLSCTGSASARERLAVFFVVDTDPALGENLTEVTIAKLAEARDFEFVGMRELDARLSEIPKVRDDGLGPCLETPACLAEVGVRASAGRAVIGTVRREGANFELELALVHTKSALAEKRTRAQIPADLRLLIEAVQTATTELIRPTETPPLSAPITPEPAPRSEPGATAPSSPLAFRTGPADRAPEPTSWKTYAGFGAAGLAIVAFSAAVITGGIATEPPTGSTRKQAQDDLERKKGYATAANVAFVAGGVFSAAAVVAFVWP
jgi:hypothetical protein